MPARPPGLERWRGRRWLPPWLRNLLPALVVLLPAFSPAGLSSPFGGPQLQTPWAALLVLAAAVVVGLRLRFPRSVLAVMTALAVAGIALNGPLASLAVALVIVVFSVARHTDRATAVVVALTAAVVVGTAAAVLAPAEVGGLRAFVQVAAWMGFAAAAGDATRSRHAYIRAITERARRAEETKESEARRRVAEERLKIARDLHDVVAHQIAVINLHANVASQALGDRPEDVERSLFAIREAARTVLGEIGGLLHILRAAEPGSAATGHDLAPVPSLADLDRMVDDFVRSGLAVDVRTVGQAVEVPEAVGVAAYRIIQEGLTNAHKHGNDASALLQIEYDPQLLEVTIINTVAATAERASRTGLTGHGLIGARERAAAVSGELQVTWGPGPVHRLTARLPLAPDQHPSAEAGPARATAVAGGGTP